MSVSAVELGVRIGVALALGALIGLERQWHHRLAGLRTNALVATGSAAAALTALAVITTNLCLRPLGRLSDRRQDTGSELDVEYRISVTCTAADETHVRALLLHAVATEPLTLRGVRAHRAPAPTPFV